MPGTKEIKRRIKSVKNTKKITKAMELVAASKMKRALASTLASRLYAEYSWDILTSVSASIEEKSHPLFTEREVNNILLVLITSNRGLCGAYNSQVIKKALTMLRKETRSIDLVTIGKKGDIGMRRIGKKVVASFMDFPANTSLNDIVPLSQLVTEEFISGRYDKVYVAYTDFISALTQKPKIKRILPVNKESLKELIEDLDNKDEAKQAIEKEQKISYLIEGDMERLISLLAEKITRMQIYQMLLESNASEQSARMVAMKNASEASGEMIDDLTLVFNKARQSNITREISEISAGMASVS